MQAARRWDDQTIEMIIGNLLRAGVLIAAIVVLGGAAIFLLRHGNATADFKTFHGEPSELRSVPGIVTDALRGRGRGIIQLGLLILIATPVARVAFSAVAFGLEGDHMYVIVTLVVLAVLIFSLTGYAP